jgi:hypothetical protein
MDRERKLIADAVNLLMLISQTTNTFEEILRCVRPDLPASDFHVLEAKRRAESNNVHCELVYTATIYGLANVLQIDENTIEKAIVLGMPAHPKAIGEERRIDVIKAINWWLEGRNDCLVSDRELRGRIRARARKWLRKYANG